MTQNAKPVSASVVHEQTYKIFPNDLNSNNTVFGGLVMSILDRVAAVVAERHSEKTCVTVSVDSLHFLSPAVRGEILLFSASVNRTWNTSMEIGLKVSSENFKTGDRRHIVSAYFTFVAVDDDGKPSAVPAIITETAIEKRRFEEAEDRRERRFQEAKDRKARRAINGGAS